MGSSGGMRKKNGYLGGHAKNKGKKGGQEKYSSKTLKWQYLMFSY